jgi:hypothetical protein
MEPTMVSLWLRSPASADPWPPAAASARRACRLTWVMRSNPRCFQRADDAAVATVQADRARAFAAAERTPAHQPAVSGRRPGSFRGSICDGGRNQSYSRRPWEWRLVCGRAGWVRRHAARRDEEWAPPRLIPTMGVVVESRATLPLDLPPRQFFLSRPGVWGRVARSVAGGRSSGLPWRPVGHAAVWSRPTDGRFGGARGRGRVRR